MTDTTSNATDAQALPPEAFDELDEILDDLRLRNDEIPQWEFCEGFMAAVLCTRRPISQAEYLCTLLSDDDVVVAEDAPLPRLAVFASDEQQARFMTLWNARWAEVEQALQAPVERLDDERTYQPEVMDMRSFITTLPPEEQAEIQAGEVPSFAQIWALGFMYAVEAWPAEWQPPRDKQTAALLDDALSSIVAMTEDDTDTPTLSMLGEDAPPGLSEARLDAYGEAIWAVYDLHQIWKSQGARVETVRKEAEPGRNDPCPCGSGQKYKKCHGA